jgi:SAM-dependent methyltransferase
MSFDPDAFNAFEAASWNERAETYEELAGRVTGRLVEPLLDAAAVGAGTRLLDVGTGPGHIAGRAANRGATVTGLDVSAAMVEQARLRYPQIRFQTGDAERLPFADEAFDAVVAGFVLLHLGRPERAAGELARVLAPGGRAALTVWDEPERCRINGVGFEAVAGVGAIPPPGLPEGPPVFRFADEDEFAALLGGAGLVAVSVETIAFTQHVVDADELWDGLMRSTVRLAAVVLEQPEPVQRRIRELFDGLLEPYRASEGFEVPVSVKLASGRKP